MLYDIGFAIFSLFYLPALIFKGKLHGDFAERFGRYSAEKRKALYSGSGAIWIQAVSVGEVALCKSLVPRLRREFPGKKIVLSTITRTGNDLARKLFSNDAVIIYFPLDFSSTVKKAIELVKPSLYIMIETEIWPNFLRETSLNNIPAILINGRISDRSFSKYKIAKPFLKDTISRISQFCMQSDLDAKRIVSMGAPEKKTRVTGNMKFDVDAKTDSRTLDTLKEALSLRGDEELFVAGSTHPHEEEILIDSYKALIADYPKLRLLIAPRHVERSGEVEEAVKKAGFTAVRFSANTPIPYTLYPKPIFILDKIGYLNSAYSFATLVFVGGSLVKHGGQNPIEPAVLGKAILFGPHMFNFRAITNILLSNNAAVQVSDGKELVGRAMRMLEDANARIELGKNASQTVMACRGATERNLEVIKEYA